jgi:hypothetical protein
MRDVRKAHIDLILATLGIQGFDESLPLDLQPLPNRYAVVTSVNKQGTLGTKPYATDNMAYRHNEIQYFVNIDLIDVNEMGYVSNAWVDWASEVYEEAVRRQLIVTGYSVKETTKTNEVPLPVNTPTISIQRKVLTFEHWLAKKS